MNRKDNIITTNRKFFDLWGLVYDWFLLKPWLYSLQKKTVNLIKLKQNSFILDVGCGTGDSLALLSEKNHYNLYGVDLSNVMLRKAEEKLKNKAIFKLGDAENLFFKNNFFDCVLSTEAFHHFPDPDLALKEIFRVLKINGKIIITDITFKSRFIKRLFKILEPGHVKIYTKEEFMELFKNNGFKITRQEKIGLFSVSTIGEKKIKK